MNIYNSESVCKSYQHIVWEICSEVYKMVLFTKVTSSIVCVSELRYSYTLQPAACAAHPWPFLHWPLALCAHSRTVFEIPMPSIILMLKEPHTRL